MWQKKEKIMLAHVSPCFSAWVAERAEKPCEKTHHIHIIQTSRPDRNVSERAQSAACGSELGSLQRVRKGEQKGETGKSAEGKWKSVTAQDKTAVSTNTEQHRHVFLRAAAACFWRGSPRKFAHHFFHYHHYLYSAVEILFSLIFLFRYVILTQSSVRYFFLRGESL